MRSQWYCWRGGQDGVGGVGVGVGVGVRVGVGVDVEVGVDDVDGGVESVLDSESGVAIGVWVMLVLMLAIVQM